MPHWSRRASVTGNSFNFNPLKGHKNIMVCPVWSPRKVLFNTFPGFSRMIVRWCFPINFSRFPGYFLHRPWRGFGEVDYTSCKNLPLTCASCIPEDGEIWRETWNTKMYIPLPAGLQVRSVGRLEKTHHLRGPRMWVLDLHSLLCFTKSTDPFKVTAWKKTHTHTYTL